jgi:hypothetical protein
VCIATDFVHILLVGVFAFGIVACTRAQGEIFLTGVPRRARVYQWWESFEFLLITKGLLNTRL